MSVPDEPHQLKLGKGVAFVKSQLCRLPADQQGCGMMTGRCPTMRRLVPPIMFLVCAATMVVLRWVWPIGLFSPFPYNLLGVVPILLGLGVGCTGALTFRKAKTSIHPFKEADKLVTAGPYRFTRNPMYLGLALVLAGIWLLVGALSAVVGLLIFVVTADRWYIAFEERMLREKFGRAFDDYRARVRRWI